MLMRVRAMEQCYTICNMRDEDLEDLSSKDCVDATKLHRQIENGEIDEWIIGDE